MVYDRDILWLPPENHFDTPPQENDMQLAYIAIPHGRTVSYFTLVLVLLTLTSSAISQADEGRKYVRFEKDGAVSYGLVEGEQVRRLKGDLFGTWSKTDELFKLTDIKILIPSVPTNVIALAGNYQDHLGDRPAPKTPEPFFKTPSCLQRHEGPVVLPVDAGEVHYEAELVIVIARKAKNVPEGKALDYVLGVTCGNDISARQWQRNDVQWWRAKGSDTFGPCGPFIAAGIDYNHLDMQLRVNGEVKQKANTKNQVHNVAQTVSFVSRYVTLQPGDLIFTGTPGKTKPLHAGDVVEVEIEGVGILRNTVE